MNLTEQTTYSILLALCAIAAGAILGDCSETMPAVKHAAPQLQLHVQNNALKNSQCAYAVVECIDVIDPWFLTKAQNYKPYAAVFVPAVYLPIHHEFGEPYYKVEGHMHYLLMKQIP